MMRSLAAALLAASVAGFVACRSTTPASSPPPGAAPATAPAPATATAGPDGAPRPRRGRDPVVTDSLRRATLAEVAQTIVGREREPAGQVFRNVQLLKDVPAAELLRTMNEVYGRGLNFPCASCHVPGQWDSDQKKNKLLARDMQRLTNDINRQLATMKLLDADYKPVTCVTCHRGSNSPPNEMPVPVRTGG